MQIRDYQQWLEAWDKARGWDRVSPSHTLIHALEELGEVARLMLQWEGYKEAESAEKLHADLEEELSDVFVFLFKLAYQTGVDVEAALARARPRRMAVTMIWRRPMRCGALSCPADGGAGAVDRGRVRRETGSLSC